MLRRISQLLGKEPSSSSSSEDSHNKPPIPTTTTIQASNEPPNNYIPSPPYRKPTARKTDPPPSLGKAARVCKEFNYISEFPDLWRALLESKHNRTALIIYAKPKKDKNDKNNNNNNNNLKTKKKGDGGAAGGVRGSVAAPGPFVTHHNAYVQGDTTLAEDNFSDYIDKVIANEHIEPEDNYILQTLVSFYFFDHYSNLEYDNWNFKELLKLSKDYASIGEALRHAPVDSRCTILVRPGVYSETLRIEQPIEIVGVGDDPSKIIVESAAPCTLPLLTVDVNRGKYPNNRDASTGKATIRNLTLIQKPSQTGDPVFCVMLKCGNILMERNVITSDSCTSVCVQHQRGRVNVRNNKITGSSAGISVFACRSDFTIELNDIYGTHYSGIELRQSTNPLVMRNSIHDTKSAGVLVFNNAKGLLMHNDIYQNVLSGVDISREGNPIVRQNKIRNSVGHGLYIYGGGKGVIENNDIYDNGKCNICIDKGGDPHIKGNRIHGALMGLSVIGEAKGIIEENEIYNHEGEGIGVLDKANPMVRRNKIFLNKRNGIIVYHEGFGTFEENEIYNNLGAFHLQRNTEAVLRDNVIHDNENIGDEITECVEKGVCTFSVTGSSFRYQAWYYCDSCETEKDLGCCESCAKTCHAGHKLSERKFSLFFCDCSTEWGCRICPSKKH